MFCILCGTKAVVSAKFCGKCGQSLPGPSKKSVIGFQEFKRQREEERRSRFEPKAKNKKAGSSAASVKKDEIINIGFMKYSNNGVLKKCRGKTLPVKVPPSASAEMIKVKAVRKHTSHDKSLHDGFEYVLLYPDGSQVEKLPGTNDPFVLEKYREDIGKNYNRITLYISTKSDFLFSELPAFRRHRR